MKVPLLFCIFSVFLQIDAFDGVKILQHTGNRPPRFFLERQNPKDFLPLLHLFLPKNAKIIDAGAYEGYESIAMAEWFPEGHIYAFEPVDQLYKRLTNTVGNRSNISTYRLALGERVEEKMIHLSFEPDWEEGKVSMSSSLYEPKEHLKRSTTQFKGTELVNVTTLDTWAEENGITQIDMLWLDMQGYELPALKASPKILSMVSVIITEVEFVEAYRGQPLYREVKNWLEGEGFILIGGTFSFPKAADQWFGDALFVRKGLIHRLH